MTKILTREGFDPGTGKTSLITRPTDHGYVVPYWHFFYNLNRTLPDKLFFKRAKIQVKD